MSEWVDFSMYAAAIVALWIVFPARGSRWTVPVVADRNPEWLAAHPELLTRLTDNRWVIRSCHIWGVVSLVVLLSFQVGLWPQAALDEEKWEGLRTLNSMLLSAGLFCCTVYSIRFARRLNKAVPLAERRQATLERRSMDDFVPRWLQIAAYALIGVHVAAGVILGIVNQYAALTFWVPFAVIAFLSAIFLFGAHMGVTRRPHAMDRIFGPAYRSVEVRYGFAMLFFPLVGFLILFGDVAGVLRVDADRAVQLGVALIITVGFLRFAMFSNTAEDPRVTTTADAGSGALLRGRASML